MSAYTATAPATAVARSVRYVSLSSGMVQTHLLRGDAPPRLVTPVPMQQRRGDDLPERTHILAHDPSLPVAAQYLVAAACARECLEAQIKYVPAVVVTQLLAALDAARVAEDCSWESDT